MLSFPSSSLYFPAVPCCFEVWKTHPTFAGRKGTAGQFVARIRVMREESPGSIGHSAS